MKKERKSNSTFTLTGIVKDWLDEYPPAVKNKSAYICGLILQDRDRVQGATRLKVRDEDAGSLVVDIDSVKAILAIEYDEAVPKELIEEQFGIYPGGVKISLSEVWKKIDGFRDHISTLDEWGDDVEKSIGFIRSSVKDIAEESEEFVDPRNQAEV